MAWDLGFKARISGDYEPVFMIEHVKMPGGVRGSIRAASHPGYGMPDIIARPGPRMRGTSVRLREWLPSVGGFSLPISASGSRWMAQLKRGQIYELRMGFPGVSPADFQTIAIGQVWNISRRGASPSWTVEFRDFIAALASRFSTVTGEQALFYDLQASTTLAADYTAGDTVVTVGSTAGFDRETGGSGFLEIQPAGADPVRKRWTSTTSTTFTTNYTGAGYPDTSAVIGDPVVELAFVDDSPIANALKVLTSTGSGTNGAYDTLPKSWSYGIPSRMVDITDAERWESIMDVAAGNQIQSLIVESEQPNGLSWMTSWQSAAGVWMVSRQGRISMRAAMPNGYGTFASLARSGAPISARISDDQIVSLDSWSAWDRSVPLEYRRVRAETSQNNSFGGRLSAYKTEAISGYPTRDAITLDFTEYRFGNGGDNVRDALRDRVAEWYLRTPVALTITTSNMRHAGLCPGDWVELTSAVVQGRLPSTAQGYDARRCMVTQVSPDWAGHTVNLSLSITSDKQDDFA